MRRILVSSELFSLGLRFLITESQVLIVESQNVSSCVSELLYNKRYSTDSVESSARNSQTLPEITPVVFTHMSVLLMASSIRFRNEYYFRKLKYNRAKPIFHVRRRLNPRFSVSVPDRIACKRSSITSRLRGNPDKD